MHSKINILSTDKNNLCRTRDSNPRPTIVTASIRQTLYHCRPKPSKTVGRYIGEQAIKQRNNLLFLEHSRCWAQEKPVDFRPVELKSFHTPAKLISPLPAALALPPAGNPCKQARLGSLPLLAASQLPRLAAQSTSRQESSGTETSPSPQKQRERWVETETEMRVLSTRVAPDWRWWTLVVYHGVCDNRQHDVTRECERKDYRPFFPHKSYLCFPNKILRLYFIL